MGNWNECDPGSGGLMRWALGQMRGKVEPETDGKEWALGQMGEGKGGSWVRWGEGRGMGDVVKRWSLGQKGGRQALWSCMEGRTGQAGGASWELECLGQDI